MVRAHSISAGKDVIDIECGERVLNGWRLRVTVSLVGRW